MSQKEMIVNKFNKEFNRLYHLMKAYWYGSDEYKVIPDFKDWANNYIIDMLHDYDGVQIISGFEKYVKEELDSKIKHYITCLSKEAK